jgi:hypothetical protein
MDSCYKTVGNLASGPRELRSLICDAHHHSDITRRIKSQRKSRYRENGLCLVKRTEQYTNVMLCEASHGLDTSHIPHSIECLWLQNSGLVGKDLCCCISRPWTYIQALAGLGPAIPSSSRVGATHSSKRATYLVYLLFMLLVVIILQSMTAQVKIKIIVPTCFDIYNVIFRYIYL